MATNAKMATKKKHPVRTAVIVVLVAVVLALCCWWAYGAFQQNTAEQGAASVRSAILNAAMQCAAIEGSYPQTLGYLEDNYGLVVDHGKYSVTYEAFASNIAPSVVVKVK